MLFNFYYNIELNCYSIDGYKYILNKIVLYSNSTLQKAYDDTRCSVAILFDDIMNGNFTRDGLQYFPGIYPLKVNLSSSNNNQRLLQ